MNGEWAETDHDFLDLISLEKGKYEFQIMAKSQNMDWSKPYFLSFRILPRFVETIWFHILIISIFVGLSSFMIIWRLKMNNKEVLEELELTERINDLNPHCSLKRLDMLNFN